ncbi:kanamycin nucleotidyltransferase C-terminal domain-containing protein [Pseudalkalibacillus berkeleyi]|uniref:KNTase domain-containing protein n=1 Tax=Pseudalkalibacillus berkeleyi TaxID=1069813 RepID=A0ABS9GXP8_9BACL|nr:kanamycin nucleotidyltransferase C-terminal domain-containing protein [Pseudalkalibacillus berkeleyi]MCF6136470.1 KNTase domain-containing protein [Pseudalkalibacillus berkeleyi]
MLMYPTATTREEKFEMIERVKSRLIEAYGEKIIAIGVYGSIGQEKEGAYSDIEMHVVSEDGFKVERQEFIIGKFKIELDTSERSELFAEAAEVTDNWPIKAGSFVHIRSIYDPIGLFEEIKKLPHTGTDSEFRDVMREFMIWEPYETMGKMRNNYESGNLEYIPVGARDLAWQTAKLIGLANRKFYTTRARTFEESLHMETKPEGYEVIARKVMEGDFTDKEDVYEMCEKLWTGLNAWFEELGIEYRVEELPF